MCALRRWGSSYAPGAARVWCVAVAVWLLPAGAAQAHSVSVSRGTLWVREDGLRAELTIPADDLLHTLRPRPDEQERLSAVEVADVVQRYGELVAEQFIVRDEAGERAAGRLVSAAHDLAGAVHYDYSRVRRARVTYLIEFDLRDRPRFVTLQQLFFGGGISHAAQLALEVRGDGDGPGQTVVLTNRGNAETIEIEWADGGAPRLVLPERFRGVRARMSAGAGGVDVEIELPVRLLETWRTVRRAEPDFLTPGEQAGALREVGSLLRGACTVEMDGRPATGKIVALAVLAPDQLSLESTAVPRRLSTWSARVAARVHFPAGRTPQQVELRWALFNNAVLEAHVTVMGDDSTTEHVLTPYAPRVSRTVAVSRQ